MVDTAPNRPSPEATLPDLPDHGVVPAVWSRITNLDVDRGEGSWLIAYGSGAPVRLVYSETTSSSSTRRRPP